MTLIPNFFCLLLNTVDIPLHLYVPISEYFEDSMVWCNKVLAFLCNIPEEPFSLLNVMRDMIAISIPRQSKFVPFFDLYGVVWPSYLVVDKHNGIFRVWCIKMLNITSASIFLPLKSRLRSRKLIWRNRDYLEVCYVQNKFCLTLQKYIHICTQYTLSNLYAYFSYWHANMLEIILLKQNKFLQFIWNIE